jgi:hypothetical protein
MRRRAIFASVAGGLAAGAGCIAGPTETGETGTNSRTRSPTTDRSDTSRTVKPTDSDDHGTTATGTDAARTRSDASTPTADVTVEDVRLQHGVVVPSSPDSIDVTNADTEYPLATVDVAGTLSREAFALSVGDERFEPTTDVEIVPVVWGDEQWYTEERGRGRLLFEGVGGASGDAASISWPGGASELRDGVASRVGQAAPAFSVTLRIPETHDAETLAVTFDVTNESDRTGRFVGALNRVGPRIAHAPVEAISEVVPAGETETLTVEDGWMDLPEVEEIGDGDADLTYHLHSVAGEQSAAVRVVEPS